MSPIRHREPGKQQAIVQAVRARIVGGVLAPGSPLSSRRLRDEFGAGASIVQAAMDTLVADGFLVTIARKGTCVSLTPPHLSTYGVVFYQASPLAYAPNGTFHSVLAHECQALQHAGGARINLYFGVTGHTDDSAYQQLQADMQAQRLAGLLFSIQYLDFVSSLLTESSLPRVVIADQPSALSTVALSLNRLSFYTKALDALAARGRRRIAIVQMQASTDPTAAQWAHMLAERQMATAPYWTLISPPIPEFMIVPDRQPIPLISTATHLMCRAADDRPDGIIITDDIFVESVLDGIYQAGMRVGQEVDVVAHCNYPLSRPDQVPIVRVGYAIRELLLQAMRLIDTQRGGNAAPKSVEIVARYTDEVAAAHSAFARPA
jgi:DNA-binding LacI/PurR family transcriptional regulator